jgi:hypothetical protein
MHSVVAAVPSGCCAATFSGPRVDFPVRSPHPELQAEVLATRLVATRPPSGRGNTRGEVGVASDANRCLRTAEWCHVHGSEVTNEDPACRRRAAVRSERTPPGWPQDRERDPEPQLHIRGEGNGGKQCTCSSRRCGSVSCRNASPSPARALEIKSAAASPTLGSPSSRVVALPVWTPAEGRRGRLAGASFSTSRCLHQW